MKIPSKLKPHLAASKDSTRYVLQNVKVDEHFISATDGRMLLMALPEKDALEKDEVTEAFLDPETCKVACKKKSKANSYIQGVVTLFKEGWSQAYVEWGTYYKTRVDETMKFPNVSNIVPDDKRIVSLNINAKLLYQLSQALGEDAVTLWIDTISEDVKAATIVLPANLKDRFGLLMPTRTTEYPEHNLALQKALKQKQENSSKS